MFYAVYRFFMKGRLGSNAEGYLSLNVFFNGGAEEKDYKHKEKQPPADIFFQKLFGKRRASLYGVFQVITHITRL